MRHVAYVIRWNFPRWEVDIGRLIIEFYLTNKCLDQQTLSSTSTKVTAGRYWCENRRKKTYDYLQMDPPEMSPFQFSNIYPVSRLLCTCRKYSCDRWQYIFQRYQCFVKQTNDDRTQYTIAARCATKLSELRFK